MSTEILWLSLVSHNAKHDALDILLSRNRLSRVIDIDIPTPLIKDAALLSFVPGEINALSLVAFGGKVGYGQKRIELNNPIEFDPPIIIDELKNKLPPQNRSRFKIQNGQIKRLSPKLWKAVHKVLSDEYIDHDKLDSLLSARKQKINWRGLSLSEPSAFVRDAHLLSANIFGGRDSRDQMAAKSTAKSKNYLESVLAGETNDIKTIEDKIVDYDASTLPGYDLIQKHPAGICQLSSETRKLITVNSNRNGIERATGVDLIYFNAIYNSYVMIQYKCMNHKIGDDSCYRPTPDVSLQKELETMRELLKNFPPCSDGVVGYRLLDNPFYLKICEPKLAGPYGHELVKGIYLPLDLFDELLKDESTKGPKGGRYMNWKSCYRRLNNTDFSRLMEDGWIGSNNPTSEIINALIEQSLTSGRHVTVSYEISRKSDSDSRFRDPSGRFANHEDPSGDWDR